MEESMDMITISVIILCHNTQGIELCVENVAPQLHTEDELIVVDDHSTTNFWRHTALKLPDCGRIIHVPGVGGNRSKNRNFGARNAKNDILVFMDGDIILSEHAIELLRTAYGQRTDVAYIGTEHGMKFTLQQAQLYYGREDYLQLLALPKERERFYHDPLFSDWRSDDLRDPQDKPYFWLRFYTSFCAVRRDIFGQSGGFDENFQSWGAEDVDLGYRISQRGGIGYLSQVHSIHIPHNRDSFRNELTNRQNTYYMLSKYLNWKFEALVVFGSTPSMLRTMEAVFQYIRAMELTPMSIQTRPNTLYIDAPCLVTWFDAEGNKTHAEMTGMAIPKQNLSFTHVMISEHIFLYPEILIVRILQEALRVGQTVLLHKAGEPTRIAWSGVGSITGIPFPRICRYANELFDFQFEELGENIRAVSSNVYRVTPDPWGQVEADWSIEESVVLVNLSSAPDATAADRYLTVGGWEILAMYHFLPYTSPEGRCLLCESIPGDFSRMNSTLVYCVDDVASVEDGKQWIAYRKQAGQELIFDFTHTPVPLRDCIPSDFSDIERCVRETERR